MFGTYAEGLRAAGYPPTLRAGTSVGTIGLFSSAESRHLLEQELLKAGARIREMCPLLNEYQRPLGNSVLKTLGLRDAVLDLPELPQQRAACYVGGGSVVSALPAEDKLSATDELRTYEPEECVVFRKTAEAFGGLSNMAAGFPLKVNGVSVRTSEALYQACRFPHRP